MIGHKNGGRIIDVGRSPASASAGRLQLLLANAVSEYSWKAMAGGPWEVRHSGRVDKLRPDDTHCSADRARSRRWHAS